MLLILFFGGCDGDIYVCEVSEKSPHGDYIGVFIKVCEQERED